MVSYTLQFKHKNNQKASFNYAEICTHVTSSAASRDHGDSAVKLTTDSYQFWVAH